MRYLTIIFLFITTFAIGQQQMFLRSTPAAGVTGILDSYTGAAAAYATALLYSSYGGSCLRVRRDSDNAEQDIGFSGQDIDEAAINTFCSGANCFVKTWYDQSGSGNNATQDTTSSQPKIYDSTNGIIYEKSITSLDLDGADALLSNFSGYSGDFALFTISIHQGGLTNFIFGIDFRENAYALHGSGGIIIYVRNSVKWNGYNLGLYNSSFLLSSTLSGTNLNTYINGSGVNSTTSDPPRFSNYLSIGATYSQGSQTFANFFTGKIQAFIYFSSDQSANRAAIESAINNYYNTYP